MTDTLPLFATQEAPAVSSGEVETLLAHLRGKGWQKAKQIEIALGWNERKVRAVAEHAGGLLLGTNRGYKLTVESTSEEMRAWDGRYHGQIQRMAERRADTWIVFTRGGQKETAA